MQFLQLDSRNSVMQDKNKIYNLENNILLCQKRKEDQLPSRQKTFVKN